MLGTRRRRRRGGAGHDVVALARADLDITDADAVRAAVARRPPRRGRQLRGLDRRRRRRGATRRRHARSTATAPGTWPPPRPRPARTSSTSRPTTSSTARRPSPTRGRDPTGPHRRLRALEARGRARRRRAPRRPRDRPHRLAVRPARQELRRHDAAARRRARRGRVVDDQVGCPTYTGHLAPALVEIAERALAGVLHVAGGGAVHLVRPRRARRSSRPALALPRPARARPPTFPRPAPRPAYSVLRLRRAPTRPCCRPGSDGLEAYLDRGRCCT